MFQGHRPVGGDCKWKYSWYAGSSRVILCQMCTSFRVAPSRRMTARQRRRKTSVHLLRHLLQTRRVVLPLVLEREPQRSANSSRRLACCLPTGKRTLHALTHIARPSTSTKVHWSRWHALSS